MKCTVFRKEGRHFRHIRTRLFFSYALILIVPCMILGIVFLNFLDHVYTEQKEKETISNLEVLGENIKFTLGSLSDVLEDGCSHIDLWYYLYHNYQYPESSIGGYYSTVRPLLDNYRKLHPEILAAKLYSANPMVVTNNQELCRLEEDSWESELLKRLEQDHRVWMLEWKPASSGPVLTAARGLRLYGKTVGLFCLELDQKRLLNLIGEESDMGSVSLIQSDGVIVLSTAEELTGRPLNEMVVSEDDTLELNGIRQKAFFVSFRVNDGGNGWQLMRTVSLGEIDLVARANMSYLILLGAVMLILMLVLSIIFSFGLTSRLSEIQHVMTDMKSGDFSMRIPVKGDDEVASLAVSFNRMMDRLADLVEENARISIQKKEAELAQREAQLNALQSQINPHFLFNALEAIQYGIRDNPEETERVLQMLARNLRRLASWERETVSLQDELRFVEEYLQIQSFRYGDRLHYRLEVDQELLQMEIPNLLLQPLAENAVIHGVAMKSCGGTVSISVQAEEQQIVLTVHDDGAGMNELEQEELRQSLSRPVGTFGSCIGLKNVYDRLQLYYNGKAAFLWESRENEFTTMKILLPKEAAHARSDC